MNFLLKLLDLYVPTWIQKARLEELFECTAAAFECNAPVLAGLSYSGCLQAYAVFTQGWIEEAVTRGADLQAVQERLYENAYRIGAGLARTFRITSTEDVMSMARIVYRTLAIDFRGTAGGEVTIARCYFSQFYSPQVCRVMSAVDAGVLAGLSGGAQLAFTQRITEGQAECRACLRREVQ